MATANGAIYPQNGHHGTNGTVTPPPGKFKPNIGMPEIVALVAITGEMVSSNFGPSEVKLQLTNGQPWYVAIAMADVIRTSGIQPRQQLEVTKTGKGQMDWKIVPLQGHLGTTAAPPQTAVVPMQAIQTTGQNNHNPDPLAACFEQAIDAIQAAQAYANRKGLGITFTSEDVRSTAISCYIQFTKGGGR